MAPRTARTIPATVKERLRKVGWYRAAKDMRDGVRISVERRREEQLLERLTAKDVSGAERAGHVLVAGPGAGSVGDEAMYRAFLAHVGRPLTVVVRKADDLLTSPTEHDNVTVVALPGLLYGGASSRRHDLLRFLQLARRAETVSIVGADVMDGVYSEAASIRRFRTARFAAAVGAETRILGFSWNEQPSRHALRELRLADPRVALCIRDVVSHERAVASGASHARQVADLAFLTPRDTPLRDQSVVGWLDDQDSANRPIVIVNANPRLETRFPDQFEAYRRVVDSLVEAGYSVLLLPHDSRGGTRSEESYIAALADVISARPEVLHVPRIMSPDQVTALAARSVFVLSGRMHLVILAAAAGVVSMGLEYQGKFAGLYEVMGYEGAVRLDGLDAEQLSTRVLTALASRQESANSFANEWSKVEAMSFKNIPVHDS